LILGLEMAEETTTTGIAAHGASRLPSVEIDSFNIELKDEEGFLGDRASKRAFRDILEKWRKPLRKTGEDPFGKEPTESISKKVLDAILVGDDVEASAVVHSAVEEFAQELAHVTRRFLKTKPWDKTERIVVGGGFRDSRLGELAIARTEIILKAESFKIEMSPIRYHPDEAALIGRCTLLPPGSSRVTTQSWPSTSAAPTSDAVSSIRSRRNRRIFPKPASGNPSYGAMPTTSRAGKRR
jgi:tRNA A37 threonylcarbamoyltransferase TsaD